MGIIIEEYWLGHANEAGRAMLVVSGETVPIDLKLFLQELVAWVQEQQEIYLWGVFKMA